MLCKQAWCLVQARIAIGVCVILELIGMSILRESGKSSFQRMVTKAEQEATTLHCRRRARQEEDIRLYDTWCGLQCTGVPISLQLSRTCSIINSFRWQQKIQLEEPNGT